MRRTAVLTPLALAVFLLLPPTISAPVLGQSQGTLDAADKLIAMKRFHEGIEAIQQVLKKVPNDPAANAILGKGQFHLARFQEARATFEKCRRLDPERYETWTAPWLARLEFWYGNDEKARAYLAETSASEFVARGLPLLLDPPGLKTTVSKHYIVYVDEQLDEREAGEFIGKIMDVIHNTYSKVLPFDSQGTYNRVYLFSDATKYREFLSTLRDTPMNSSVSFYSENYRALLVNADAQGAPTNKYGIGEQALARMFRTGFSQFRHLHAPALPDWYEKGMGGYFAASQVNGKNVTVGHVIRTNPRGEGFRTEYSIVKEAVADASYLPLSSFLTCSDDDFNDKTNNRSIVNAAQAWSMVHFLLHDRAMKKTGRKLLAGYFNMMCAGKSREEAFSQTFGKLDLKELKEKWLEYVGAL